MKRLCNPCEGTGLEPPLNDAPCSVCGGMGQVVVTRDTKAPSPRASGRERVCVQVVEALCELEDLSDWEADFADSLYKQVERGRQLTHKQLEKGNQILVKHGQQPYGN